MTAAAVCHRCVSKCGSEGADPCLPRHAHQLFLSHFWALVILKKLNAETRVYRTKFGIVTCIVIKLIVKPQKRHYDAVKSEF